MANAGSRQPYGLTSSPWWLETWCLEPPQVCFLNVLCHLILLMFFRTMYDDLAISPQPAQAHDSQRCYADPWQPRRPTNSWHRPTAVDAGIQQPTRHRVWFSYLRRLIIRKMYQLFLKYITIIASLLTERPRLYHGSTMVVPQYAKLRY